MKITATITFLKRPGNTGDWHPRSGYKPQLKVKDRFTSCTVWADKRENLIFEWGTEYRVNLEPQSGKCMDGIYLGMPVQLNEGSRIVATGIVIELLT